MYLTTFLSEHAVHAFEYVLDRLSEYKPQTGLYSLVQISGLGSEQLICLVTFVGFAWHPVTKVTTEITNRKINRFLIINTLLL